MQKIYLNDKILRNYRSNNSSSTCCKLWPSYPKPEIYAVGKVLRMLCKWKCQDLFMCTQLNDPEKRGVGCKWHGIVFIFQCIAVLLCDKPT